MQCRIAFDTQNFFEAQDNAAHRVGIGEVLFLIGWR